MQRIALFTLLLLGVAALSGCDHLAFQPYREHLLDPAQVGIEVEDVAIATADGLKLHGWFLEAKQERPHGTVLFLHGNAENISTHLGSVWWLPNYGYNVLLFDYRGFGRSHGEPSIEGLHIDFSAALAYLRSRRDIDSNRFIIFGQSMGAATTITAMAALEDRDGIRAVVVEGAFTSYRKVAREALAGFWLTWPLQWPLSLAFDNDHRPIDAIAGISPIPLLIIHSEADTIIPIHHAEQLFAAAKAPKEFWRDRTAPHIGVFTQPQNRERLVKYLNGVLAER